MVFALRLLALCLFFLSAPAWAQMPAFPGTGGAEAPQEEEGADPSAGVESLIRILEDDAARETLIERLREGAAGTPEAEAAAAAEGTADPTLARQVAEYTRDIAEQAQNVFGALGGIAANIGEVFAGTADIDGRALWNVVLNVAAVVLVTFGVFLALRWVAARIFGAMAHGAENGGVIKRGVLLVGSSLVDTVSVVLAWAIGYVFALQTGVAGRIGINQTLFLNAFLFVELAKVAARLVFAPRYGRLRLTPLDDTDAAYWYFWLSRILSLLGYTFLFIAPILTANVSVSAAHAVRIVVVFTAVMMGIAIVLQNKERVRTVLLKRTEAGKTDALARFYALLGRYWHAIAIVYLVAIFLAWLTHPERALPFMVAATVQSLVAIVLGTIVATLISRFISGGMHLPQDVKERLPLLETRLNAFVPTVLKVVRVIVLVVVIVAIAQAWAIVDFVGWLSSEVGRRVAGSIISAGIILLIGGLLYLAMSSWVEYRLNPNFGKVPTARERTLLSLFRNAFTVALAILVFMLALAELGVNIGPLLAGAGVLGLAIGFGAQKLVQDIITGAFIQLENAMNEGDVVMVGGISGVVEKLTIRSVGIRDLDGTYHLIPFSSVDAVSNFMKTFSYHVAEIRVAYRENIGEVKTYMQEAFDRLARTEHGPTIIAPLEMHGVTQLDESAIVVRARIKTLPGSQWAVGRDYNEIVKEIFDERGIEIPFPHVTLYMGEDKAGKSPPLRVVDMPGGKAGNGGAREDASASESEAEEVDEAADDAAPSMQRASRRRRAGRPRKLEQDGPNEEPDDPGR